MSASPAFDPARPQALDDQAQILTLGTNQVASGWLQKILESFGKNRQSAQRGLSIEGRLSVGGKNSVTLIACHGRRFLVASSGDSIAPMIEVRPLTSSSTMQQNEE